MSQPIVINSLVFAREARSLQGELPIASLARVLDKLTNSVGELRYRIEGQLGPRNRAQLLLQLDGALSVCCQRCLEAIDYRLDLHSLLEFVDSDGDLTQEELEDDSRDFLPNQRELDVAVLIEDEILLALPTAPRHDDCALPGSGQGSATVSPFSVLAGFHGRA